jgi:hypothetical protein
MALEVISDPDSAPSGTCVAATGFDIEDFHSMQQ